MTTLKAWLASIQMEKYLEVFESHAIDLDIFAHLTEPELSGLGTPLATASA